MTEISSFKKAFKKINQNKAVFIDIDKHDGAY